jgi:hypothetical protein
MSGFTSSSREEETVAEEKRAQDKMLKFLKDKGVYHFKTMSATKAGVADITACVRGRFISIEMKSTDGELSGLQEENKEQVHKSGGLWYTADLDNLEMIKKELMSILTTGHELFTNRRNTR